jgi:hypothetical protein
VARWRIEDLDPPGTERHRVADPMERVAMVVVVVFLVAFVGGALLGARGTPAVSPAPFAQEAYSPEALPTAFAFDGRVTRGPCPLPGFVARSSQHVTVIYSRSGEAPLACIAAPGVLPQRQSRRE